MMNVYIGNRIGRAVCLLTRVVAVIMDPAHMISHVVKSTEHPRTSLASLIQTRALNPWVVLCLMSGTVFPRREAALSGGMRAL